MLRKPTFRGKAAMAAIKESQSTDFQMFGFKIPKRQRFPDAVAYCVSSKEAH